MKLSTFLARWALLGTAAVTALAQTEPDLAVTLQTPGSVQPNASAFYTVTVRNAGDAVTGGDARVRLTLFDETNNVVASYDSNTAGQNLGAGFGIGASTSYEIPLTLPGDQVLEFGDSETIRAVAVVSSAGAPPIGETELANNQAEATTTVSAQPDLQIEGIDYTPGSFAGGEPNTFALVFANNFTCSDQGQSFTRMIRSDERYRISVRLSLDNAFDDDDFELKIIEMQGDQVLGASGYLSHETYVNDTALLTSTPSPANNELWPGELVELTWNQRLPHNYSGTYYVVARIDQLEAIDECTETSTLHNGNNDWIAPDSAKISLAPTPAADITRVSLQNDGSEAEAPSDFPDVSGDGRYVVFESLDPLVAEDMNSVADIYLRDTQTGTLTLVSARADGASGNGPSRYARISDNGQVIVFTAYASDLVPGDGNGHWDIFRYERTTGQLLRISQLPDGSDLNGSSFLPDLDNTGTRIVFESTAANVASTVPGRRHIYVYDHGLGTLELVSRSNGGAEGDAHSYEPAISGDGAIVAYASFATNLVGSATASQQIFRYDAQAGTTTLVSVDNGSRGNARSTRPSIDGDGSVIVFTSEATNFGLARHGIADTNNLRDLYVWESGQATLQRLLTSGGAQPVSPTSVLSAPSLGSYDAQISDDGQVIVFTSDATNLQPDSLTNEAGDVFNAPIEGFTDDNSGADIYLWDRLAGTVELASTNRFGFPTSRLLTGDSSPSSYAAAISGNARTIVFASDAENTAGLVHGATNTTPLDGNGVRDVFRIVRATGALSAENVPAVALVYPAPTSTSTRAFGSTVTLVADATPVDLPLTRVDFYANHLLIGSVTTPVLGSAAVGGRYALEWTPDRARSYVITARAYDAAGLVSTPATAAELTSVAASGSQSPAVAVTYPQALSGFTASSTLRLYASAADPDGAVQQVEFWVNGQSVGSDLRLPSLRPEAYPYSAAWTVPAEGFYTIVARATDNSGNAVDSAAVHVSATGGSLPPQVSLPGSLDGAQLSVDDQPFDLTAENVSDDGVVQYVSFLVNGQEIGQDWAPPYTSTWSPTEVGRYELVAVALDDSGNRGSSAPATVDLAFGSSPVVTLTTPSAGDAFRTGAGDITLSAEASDTDGSIASVEFYADGVLIGTDNDGADGYSVTWPAAGPPLQQASKVQLTAKATDNLGFSGFSSPVEVELMDNLPPRAAITRPVAGASIQTGLSEDIVADVVDPDGSIVLVEFFANTTLIGSATSATQGLYAFAWVPEVQGDYALSVRATDNEGAFTVSEAVDVVVDGTIVKPDLQANALNLISGESEPGATLTYTVRYQNTGQADVAQTSPFDVTLSVVDDDGLAVATTTFTHTTGLGANEDSEVPIGVTLPLDIGLGEYALHLMVDSGDAIDESEESNNLYIPLNRSVSLQDGVDGVKPDLQITDLSFQPGDFFGGDPVDVSITWENVDRNELGRRSLAVGADQRYRISVRLSSDGEVDDGDFELFNLDVEGDNLAGSLAADGVLVAGESVTYTWTQAMPRNLAGDWIVLARVDDLDAILEAGERDPFYDQAKIDPPPEEIWENNVWAPLDQAMVRLLPANEAAIARISITTADTDFTQEDPRNGVSERPDLSDDGRYVVFETRAALDEDDLDQDYDIYLRDQWTGETTLISRAIGGQSANGRSREAVISGDGRFIVFSSDASNIVVNDVSGHADIYRYNRIDDTFSVLTINDQGVSSNAGSFRPAISRDGRYVVFESYATNLVATPSTFGQAHIFVHDADTREVRRLDNALGSGAAANGSAFNAAISDDGQYVVYTSTAPDLVPGTPTGTQIYRTAIDGSSTILVSQSTTGIVGNAASQDPDINADGSVVVFASQATNLVPGDTNAISDIFVRELPTGGGATTTRLLTANGTQPGLTGSVITGNLGNLEPRVSADGSTVVFRSEASDWLRNTVTRSDGQVFNIPVGDWISGYSDLNRASDIYLVQRDTGVVERVSVNRFGFETRRGIEVVSIPASRQPALSANARFVVFASDATGVTGLVHGLTNRTSPDVNAVRDIFLVDRRTDSTVATGEAPTVEIVNPAAGQGNIPTFVFNEQIPLVAVATDNREVAKVDFYASGLLVGTAEASSGQTPLNGGQLPERFSVVWQPTEGGIYQLTAIAEDDEGNRSSSVPVPVSISDGLAPTVSIISPPSGGSYIPGTRLPVQALAADGDGLIERVEFYLNGSRLSTVLTGPFQDEITLPSIGTYSLTAIAWDNDGNSTLSEPRIITAGALDDVTPRVVFSHPLLAINGDTQNDVSVASDMFLNALVEIPENGAPVSRISFLMNGQSIREVSLVDGELPVGSKIQRLGDNYSLYFAPNAMGNYSLTVEVEDELGRVGQSVPLSLIVGPLIAEMPLINLQQPPTETPIGQSVDFIAFIDAGVAQVNRVDFYVRGVLVGSSQTPEGDGSYKASWIPTTAAFPELADLSADNIDVEVTARVVEVEPLGAAFDNWKISAPVTMSITPASIVVPEVTLTEPQPAPGETFTVLTPISLRATASATGSTVAEVRFQVNGATIATDDTWPYTATFTPQAIGTFEIKAQAVDLSGQVGEVAAPTILEVVESATPPSVSLEFPLEPGPVDVAVLDPVELRAAASSTASTVASVHFYVNGTLIGSDETFPYTFSWAPPSVANYTIQAVAEDAAGNFGESAEVTLRAQLSVQPEVSLINPVLGATGKTGVPVLFLASATSLSGGAKAKVEFLVNGQIVNADETYPYSTSWTPASAGAFSITARLIETQGENILATASSTPVTITISEGDAPVVTFLSPGQPGLPEPTVGSDVLITVGATDADGTIASVEVFVDGVRVGEPGAAVPYSTFWRPTAEGDYDLSTLVIDNSGNQVLEASVVSVKPPVGSVPSLTLDVTGDGLVTPGSKVMLSAAVVDDDAEGMDVTFFMNNQPLSLPAGREGPPYFIIVEPEIANESTRSYQLSAIAVDKDGNSRATTLAPLFISDQPLSLPAVELVTPQPGYQLTEGSRATLRARLSGTAALQVKDVIFYANGIEIGRDATAPYTLDWLPDQTGDVEITAGAIRPIEFYDHDKNPETTPIEITPATMGTTAAVSVQPASGALPSIAMEVLPRSSGITVGSNVLFYADVDDTDDGVASVRFFVDGLPIGDFITAPPYALKWQAPREGSFFVSAEVRDAASNVVTSTILTLDVAGEVKPNRSVTISVPDSGQEGSLLPFSSTTAGFINGPDAVEFFINGQRVGMTGDLPYHYDWAANITGEVFAFATAERRLDSLNFVTAVSEVKPIELRANEAPVIAGFAYTFPGRDPATNPNPRLNIPLSFAVEATDSGPITRVDLLRDGALVATSTSLVSPYVVTDTPPSIGNYVYSILVTDSAGAQVTNLPAAPNIAVQVVADEPPAPPVGDAGQGLKSEDLVALSAPDTYTARLNTPITWDISLTDPFGLSSIVLYRNNAALPKLDGSDTPKTITDTPPGEGTFIYYAEATDTSGNVGRSRNVTVVVSAGSAPIVTFAEPLNQAEVATGSPVNVRVTATPAAESDNLPLGSIESVVLRANGTEFARLEQAPFTAAFNPASAGTWTLSATAFTDTGRSAQATVVVEAIEENLPVILSFTHNAGTGGALWEDIVTFTVEATDAKGITSVEILEAGSDSPLATDFAAPYEVPLVFSRAPGDPFDVMKMHLFQARVRNTDGNTATSSVLSLTVGPPDVEENSGFVFQTFLDLLKRAPTDAEEAEYLARLEAVLPSERQAEQRRIIRDLFLLPDYQQVHDVLKAYRMLATRWPTQDELQNAVDLHRREDLATVVAELLPDFEQTYIEAMDTRGTTVTRIPGPEASEVARDRYAGYLWELKYGIKPNGDQLSRMRLYNRSFSMAAFTALVVSDALSRQVGLNITLSMGINNPPNQDLERVSDAASLLLNLLRLSPEATDSVRADATSAFYELSERLFLLQIQAVLEDPRYQERFAPTQMALSGLAPMSSSAGSAGWQESLWFGPMLPQSGQTDLYFHADLGWVELERLGQSDLNMAFYDWNEGWLWTCAAAWPWAWKLETGGWMLP